MRTFNLLVIGLLAFTGCKKEEILFNESYIQIEENKMEHTIYYGHSGTTDSIYVPISIIGKALETDNSIEIDVTSDDIVTISNDTVSLLEILSYDSKKTIQSSNTSDNIIIVLDIDRIKSQKNYSFTLTIRGEEVAENYNTIEVMLYKQALIDVFSGDFLCYEKEYNHTYTMNILHTNPVSDTLLLQNFWNFSQSGTHINAILNYPGSGEITIPEQQFEDLEGKEYTVSASGTFNENGEIKIQYLIKGIGFPFYEENEQIYSRLDK